MGTLRIVQRKILLVEPYRESIFNTQFFQVTTRQYTLQDYIEASVMSQVKQKGYLVYIHHLRRIIGSFGGIIGKKIKHMLVVISATKWVAAVSRP